MPKYTSDTLLLLRKRLRLDQEEMGRLLGVTRSFVSRMERDRFEISPATAERMEELALRHGINLTSLLGPSGTEVPEALEEEAAPFDTAGGDPFLSREQIEARLKEYLDLAEKVPGGLGYAWGQVCIHLSKEPLLLMKAKQLATHGRRIREGQGGEHRQAG